MTKKFSTLLIFFIIISLLGASYYFSQSHSLPHITIDKQESAVNFKNNFFSLIHLGNKRLITDWLWIQTLLESDITHYQNNNLGSWMFLRFDLITDLDPLFLMAYNFGGKYLSVIKDDDLGAEQILQKGLAHYPSDWNLNFYLGLHYLIEIRNPQKAYPYFLKIENDVKTPLSIKSIIIKIKKELFGKEIAYNFLLTAYNNETEDGPLKKKWEEDLYSLKTEIDLDCLNNKKNNCNTKNFYGESYTYSNLDNKYHSPRQTKKYQINLPKTTVPIR